MAGKDTPLNAALDRDMRDIEEETEGDEFLRLAEGDNILQIIAYDRKEPGKFGMRYWFMVAPLDVKTREFGAEVMLTASPTVANKLAKFAREHGFPFGVNVKAEGQFLRTVSLLNSED